MASRQSRLASCGLFAIFLCWYLASRLTRNITHGLSASENKQQHRPPLATQQSLTLTRSQCDIHFPGLTKSIDDVVAEGPFLLKNTGEAGPLQGRIKDGKIYIVNAQRRADLSDEMINSRTAALHQLHRALIMSPEPVPDTIFSLNFQDQPFGTAWGYSRPIDPALRSQDRNERAFLIPHFSFWAWKLPFVGSMARAAAAIAQLEKTSYPRFIDKIPRAVWRGTAYFNSVHSPHLRQNLLAATKDKTWADVQALEWVGGGAGNNHQGHNASNALAIEDFCRYRYVLHTEGIAYSGRFQFLQMCNSITITPPILWMQHTTHLVKPIFSSHLLENDRNRDRRDNRNMQGNSGAAARKPSGHKSWLVSYPVDEANIVFVAPDWSDLENTVAWLEAHPTTAKGIAGRQQGLFLDGGYFSPASEVCYWRALVHGWSKVAQTIDLEWAGQNEVPYETFALSNGY